MDAEEKKALLREIYDSVLSNYSGTASNGGKLAPVPSCVKTGYCMEDYDLSYTAIKVLMQRYLSRDAKGRIVETPLMMWMRVAEGFKSHADKGKLLGLLKERRFIFNSPTLFNMYADGARGALSACYVTPIRDNMESIMEAARVQALTFKYGGGQGFSFSNLRPRNALVKGTGSTSSGPISFMKIFDTITESVKQGGKRRGANMGILHDWHPDIYNPEFNHYSGFMGALPYPVQGLLKNLAGNADGKLKEIISSAPVPPEEAGFIQAKRGPLGDVHLTNFNISVGVHDAFMKAVINDEYWYMVNPQLTGETTIDGDYRVHYSVSRATGLGLIGDLLGKHENPFLNILEDKINEGVSRALEEYNVDLDSKNPYAWRIKAREIWENIVESAWESADPGLIFLDNHNKYGPTPWLGVTVATNPCVSRDTLVLTPTGLRTAKMIYEEARKTGVTSSILTDESVLGEGGERIGYKTIMLATVILNAGIGTAIADSVVWKIGVKKGFKIILDTGHAVKVTREHKLLVWDLEKNDIDFVEAEKIAENPDKYKVPIYLAKDIVDTYKAEAVKRINRREAILLAGLLLSHAKILDDTVYLPLSREDSQANGIRELVKKVLGSNCILEDSDVRLVINKECLPERIRSVKPLIPAWEAVVSSLEIGDIPVLVDAIFDLVPFDERPVIPIESVKHVLPVIAQLLQFSGWVLKISGEGIRAVKVDDQYYLADVIAVEEVEDEFYDFTVPIYHSYMAGGLVHHNCGEQHLYAFESCNLGSISIEKYVENGAINVEKLYEDVKTIIDAMDAVIDLNKHPDGRHHIVNQLTRKIGLGIMGLADLLAKLGIPYDSDEAVAMTATIMAAIDAFGWVRSWELGKERGPAPAFYCKVYDWNNFKCLEEATPEETLEWFNPALRKAGAVMRRVGRWVAVKYHDVEIPEDVIDGLEGEARKRILPDGTVLLYTDNALGKILSSYWGITKNHYYEALEMPPEQLAKSPRHILALAVYDPGRLWEKIAEYGKSIGAEAPRNTAITTVAPTGSISILAGTSSGIEPYFALVYYRSITAGVFREAVRLFREDVEKLLPREIAEEVYDSVAKHKGSLRWALPELLDKLPSLVAEDGKYRDIAGILEDLARKYATSMDFDPWYHVAHNAAAQLYVDQAISKTVNLPKDAPVNSVHTVYLTAWLAGLKGVTVYRDESKSMQVIYFGEKTGEEKRKETSRPVHNGDGNGKKRKRLSRMILPKLRVKTSQLEKDARAIELFSIKPETSGESVVVELEVNSTCTTCEF